MRDGESNRGRIRSPFRGFPEHLRTTACWFVEQGEAIRRVFPTVTTLSVYRLNDWRWRFARLKFLRGLRELRVPCWVGPLDVAALTNALSSKGVDSDTASRALYAYRRSMGLTAPLPVLASVH